MGVVRVRRVGNRSYYRIAAGHLERLLTEGKRVLAEAK
jgi:DNA-binding transcriptional ArsR family regulator